jgi:hypothetical protein
MIKLYFLLRPGEAPSGVDAAQFIHQESESMLTQAKLFFLEIFI